MTPDLRAQQRVFDQIDADDLVKLTLDLGNIDSPTGSEGPVAEYVADCLTREGFGVKKVGIVPDRPNVIGVLPGTGRGKSLVFNRSATARGSAWAAERSG
jgi:acetylornithine deacetylase/succinyl-diaminopimelate desuccinylase-like protein